MQQTHVFTSAALNYIPKVRVLFRSIREHHPEWKLHLALADELPADVDLSGEPFDEVMPIGQLDIPDLRGWAFCHTIVELATAIKPFMLSNLLGREDAARVIYLDPDIVVFSRLDDIVEALDEANILLTPHQTHPESTLEGVMDNEISSLKHGVYNLGFVAVAANDEGKRFADWWGKRIYHFCRADIPNGLFTDQRWIDLVPAFFDGVAVMKSTRHNVATWNLTTREFTRNDDGQYRVDGLPLGFYHFTGFDSGAHQIMAKKNAAGNRSVGELIDWYKTETGRVASDPLAKQKWAFGHFTDGTPIDPAQRLVYRERIDLQAIFPNPFDADGYLKWWNDQARHEYPDLFESKYRSDVGSGQLMALSPGFRSGRSSKSADWGKVRQKLSTVIYRPSEGFRLTKKGYRMIRSVGLRGLKEHLKSN